MNPLRALYRDSLGLLTDLYQVTMAYAYWKAGLLEREAVFHLFFRKQPFDGGFAIACGLEPAVEYLRGFHFENDDLTYLEGLTGNDDRPLFEPRFLEYLSTLRLTCDVDAVPEGTPVFPHEPLVRISGKILECQLLETPLLNLINFPTLTATKAARVCLQAQDDAVVEFGLRRAQGIDGGITAARAAYVGGCVGTSNVLAGKLFGIPIMGTHAHSWVMCFDDELEAFRVYAEAMPNNCVFLVDTYNTRAGLRNAVQVCRALRERGHEAVGIRLDSGDLAALSIDARKLLDESGFPDAKIVASSELDEYEINRLKQRGAKINVWGVGTKLATAYDSPALGGVYKLSAVRDPAGSWRLRIKLSDDVVKSTNPGIHQVRRFLGAKKEYLADLIYDLDSPPQDGCRMISLGDDEHWETFPADTRFVDLLQPVLRRGDVVYHAPPLAEVRERTRTELARIPDSVKQLRDPATYPVGLDEKLYDRKLDLMREAREDKRI